MDNPEETELYDDEAIDASVNKAAETAKQWGLFESDAHHNYDAATIQMHDHSHGVPTYQQSGSQHVTGLSAALAVIIPTSPTNQQWP